MRSHLFTQRYRRIPRWLNGVALLLLVAAPLVALAGVPGLTANIGLGLGEGLTAPITSALLNSSDNDTPTTGLYYRLARVPAHGRLQLSRPSLPQNFVVPPGFAFTQDDINKGYLTYTNDDSAATSDSFDFTLADSALPNLSIASISTSGTVGDGDSVSPALSADGRYVAFASLATNLVSGDTNNAYDWSFANSDGSLHNAAKRQRP